MIQRIQTLFLFIAAALLFSIFCTDFATNAETAISYMEYRPFTIFSIVAFVISLVTIFLFKNRPLQMRLCIYDIVILLAFQGWIIYMLTKMWGEYRFSVTCAFPLVAGLLTTFAFRYINKDEALVRASSSLRSLSKKHQKRRRK